MPAKYLFPILFTALVFSACTDDPDPIPNPMPPKPTVLFPWLQTGNRWVYDMVYNGQVADSLWREIGAVDANGIYTSVMEDNSHSLTEYFFRDGEWLMYFQEGQTRAEAVQLSKGRPRTGDTWIKPQLNDTLDVVVVQTDTPVAVPAGLFHCRKLVESSRKTGKTIIYLQDADHGLIGIESTYNGKPISYRLRSINF